MNPTDAEHIDPENVHIVANFDTVKQASVEARAQAKAAKVGGEALWEALHPRQQEAYRRAVVNEDKQRAKRDLQKAEEEAAEARLVDIERRLTALERRTAPPGLPDMSGYL
jgi:hypothetical protein